MSSFWLADGGAVCRSEDAFDKQVVGIASGVGAYQLGIVLDRHRVGIRRMPVAADGAGQSPPAVPPGRDVWGIPGARASG
jgi:hypothetical protein